MNKRVLPVTAVEFEDHGQDFLVWFIRDGRVIESDMQNRIWINTRVTRKPVVGQLLHILRKTDHKYVTMNYPLVKVTECTPEEAEAVYSRYREMMKEIINE